MLITCVRTFCRAGTKIPRHLLQKEMILWTRNGDGQDEEGKVTCDSPRSSNRIQPPPLLDQGQEIQKTFLRESGEVQEAPDSSLYPPLISTPPLQQSDCTYWSAVEIKVEAKVWHCPMGRGT